MIGFPAIRKFRTPLLMLVRALLGCRPSHPPVTLHSIIDKYGTILRAFLPLPNPKFGPTRVVGGIDIQVHDWMWSLLARTALPIGLIWIFRGILR